MNSQMEPMYMMNFRQLWELVYVLLTDRRPNLHGPLSDLDYIFNPEMLATLEEKAIADGRGDVPSALQRFQRRLLRKFVEVDDEIEE